MSSSLPSVFKEWESFYVIIGSSAAALTGLQFVVIALVAELRARSTTGSIDAFGTPTIFHFCAALFVAVTLSAPWPAMSSADLVLGAAAVTGVFYTGLVARRARRQTGYTPVFEDWIWHTALPFLAYATLLSGALTLERQTMDALFAIAASTVLLLFIGIHNAWDSVVYIVQEHAKAPPQEQ